MIRTVLGDVAGKIGHCQCHEHLFLANGKPFIVDESLKMEDESASVAELRAYARAGGGAVVDAQPIGCGRMVAELTRASKASEVAIIASTGFHKLVFYPSDHWVFSFDEEQLSELWAREIEEGMFVRADDVEPSGQIDARAGIIKVAVDSEGIVERYKALFYAAAKTSVRTGAAILCHVEKDVDPMNILAFFDTRGVASERIILCHLDRANPSAAKGVAAAGAFIEFDTIARYKYHSDEEELRQIKKILDAGYANKLLLSLDTTNRRLTHYGGQIGLSFLLESFIPMLAAHGVDELCIHRIFYDNPIRAISIRA